MVLALTAATLTLGLASKNSCARGAWWHEPRQYANLCYSDLPYQYVNGGAERVLPLSDSDGRFPQPTESPATAVLTYATGLVTHLVVGWPDTMARSERPVGEVAVDPQVRHEAVVYVGVAATLLLLAALWSTWCVAKTHRNRPWDAAGFAAAPVLLLSAFIGWDLMSMACVAGAMLAWSRRREFVAGLFLGVGTALAVYPALLLVAFGVVAVRAGRSAAAAQSAAAALTSWALIMVPSYLLAPMAWRGSFDAYVAGGPGNGSLWQLLTSFGIRLGSTLTNQLSLVCALVLVVGLLWFAMAARRRPRLPQLALLLVLVVLLVGKQYAPQYALWLLPLAVLARPYWRDLLIWQAGEICYFLAIWWHLGGYTDGGTNGVDEFYIAAIGARILGQLWLGCVVLRDIRHPWLDPVRADALTDDPAGGVADRAADAVVLVR